MTGVSGERPKTCRNRQRDEGQPYPRSGCDHCHNGGLMGCPFEAGKGKNNIKIDISPDAKVADLEEYIEELRQVVANYLVLGKGKCTIGKPLCDMALAALQKDWKKS